MIMFVHELIKVLERFEVHLPLMVENKTQINQLNYASRFSIEGNTPHISALMEEPLPHVKTVGTLLNELRVINDEEFNNTTVYAEFIHEYVNESYDFRYFALLEALDEGEFIKLVTIDSESIELREHHEAIDEDMFDTDG